METALTILVIFGGALALSLIAEIISNYFDL